jgi:hypothetical protein
MSSRHRIWRRIVKCVRAMTRWFLRVAIPACVTAVLSFGLAVWVPSWIATPSPLDAFPITGTSPVVLAYPRPADPIASDSATGSLAVLAAETLPVTTNSSLIWSGYFVGNGPYSSVSGTFNVPRLTAAPFETMAAEWVGIDGTDESETLIQAGVTETYDPSSDLVYTNAFWEILPAVSTTMPISVTPGDTVTVLIWKVTGTLWGIALTDETTGQTFITDQTFRGPQATADWIVEDPVPCTSCWIGMLGTYSPDVTFRGLRASGPETVLTAVTMLQGTVTMSVPSTMTPAGFSVTYADAPSPLPGPARR